MPYGIHQPVSQYSKVEVRHRCIIILVLDRVQDQIGFQCAEGILYLPDGVVNVPDHLLFLYIQVGAKEVNTKAFIFSLMFVFVFLPAKIRYQVCFPITADVNVIMCCI